MHALFGPDQLSNNKQQYMYYLMFVTAWKQSFKSSKLVNSQLHE